MDIVTSTSVKAAIKAWERNFKATHRREPTVDDIKQHPSIADKYRLYKKLSKAATAPTTPPQPSRPSLPHSRPAQSTAPLTSFNPFSPQKNRLKQEPPTNPYPLLLSASSLTPPAPSTALYRARKRLRGEPVSPSPNKGKRPRLGSNTLPAPPDSSSSEDDADAHTPSYFLSNSPVKAPRGSKSFKLLFHDTTKSDPSVSTSTLMRTKSTRALFAGKSVTTSDDHLTLDLTTNKDRSEVNKAAKRSLSTSDPEDAIPISAAGPSILPPSPPPLDCSTRANKFSGTKSKAAKPTGRKKNKSAHSSDHSNSEESSEDMTKTNIKIVSRMHSRLRNNGTAIMRQQPDEGDLDSDLDPILAHALRVLPHGPGSPRPPGAQLEGKFEVDLPDKLRNVLALESVEPKARSFREERLVKGLVSGTRVTRYDPVKGGEIWDAGEDNAASRGDVDTWRDTEGEDDWEGEPVPWEVGEL